MTLSNEEKYIFIKGFIDNAPACYDFDTDIMTPMPWCTPWEWAEKEDYMVDGMTPYMMGKDFAKKYNSEIVKAFSE